jgi:hypothetical protein
VAAQLDRFREHPLNLADEICARQLREFLHRSTIAKIDMEKPTAQGPTPARKAHIALGEKLNRKSKPPPPLPVRPRGKMSASRAARSFDWHLV